MKIPPRCMFAAQFYGTILGGIVNYVVLKIILAAKRPVLQGIVPDPTGE
jgi:OPT oligopeptide transporter protein